MLGLHFNMLNAIKKLILYFCFNRIFESVENIWDSILSIGFISERENYQHAYSRITHYDRKFQHRITVHQNCQTPRSNELEHVPLYEDFRSFIHFRRLVSSSLRASADSSYSIISSENPCFSNSLRVIEFLRFKSTFWHWLKNLCKKYIR